MSSALTLPLSSVNFGSGLSLKSAHDGTLIIASADLRLLQSLVYVSLQDSSMPKPKLSTKYLKRMNVRSVRALNKLLSLLPSSSTPSISCWYAFVPFGWCEAVRVKPLRLKIW